MTVAKDKSARQIDVNGWMYIERNPISKEGVFDYLGSEIGAPDPDRVYKVYRPGSELEKAADSFKLIPIIDDHELLGDAGTSTDERPPAGFVGSNVHFDAPYLVGDIKITSPTLLNKIKGGKVELSPAYFCDWEPLQGTFDGLDYDYVQRIKAGNHLALVDVGRTGADVAVLDERAAITAIDRYAFDTGVVMDLQELVASLSDEDKQALLALLAPAVVDKETEEEGTAGDETPEEEQAADETAEEEEKPALDAAAIAADAMAKAIKHIDARNAMIARVQPHIGSVPKSAQDSAATVAVYALQKLGLKATTDTAEAILTGYLHNRNTEVAVPVKTPKRSTSVSQYGWED